MYWKLSSDGNVVVVGFDLGAETMKVMPMPNWGCSVIDAESVTIGVLGGCLCLCRENCDQGIEIWSMKEHGERGSWVKWFCLPRTTEIADLTVGDCEFFGFTKTRKFLMHSKEKLMLVDPHEKPVQYTQIMESPGQIVSYCPSMVSPFVAEALMKQVNGLLLKIKMTCYCLNFLFVMLASGTDFIVRAIHLLVTT